MGLVNVCFNKNYSLKFQIEYHLNGFYFLSSVYWFKIRKLHCVKQFIAFFCWTSILKRCFRANVVLILKITTLISLSVAAPEQVLLGDGQPHHRGVCRVWKTPREEEGPEVYPREMFQNYASNMAVFKVF